MHDIEIAEPDSRSYWHILYMRWFPDTVNLLRGIPSFHDKISSWLALLAGIGL